uniref:Uncharacterized protein n=1 Tax=Salix viminalis TaxID=40686 RepID=A0A6N2MBN8_SALVM
MLSSRTIRSPEKPESKFVDEEEAEELERLETQVKQIAKKILEYRATLPDQLKTTVASLPSSQRPISPDCDSGTDPGPPGKLNPGQIQKSGIPNKRGPRDCRESTL